MYFIEAFTKGGLWSQKFHLNIFDTLQCFKQLLLLKEADCWSYNFLNAFKRFISGFVLKNTNNHYTSEAAAEVKQGPLVFYTPLKMIISVPASMSTLKLAIYSMLSRKCLRDAPKNCFKVDILMANYHYSSEAEVKQGPLFSYSPFYDAPAPVFIHNKLSLKIACSSRFCVH
jgi:hypothetical protein